MLQTKIIPIVLVLACVCTRAFFLFGIIEYWEVQKLQCTLQLPEVHTFIGISPFVHVLLEIMICTYLVPCGGMG